MLELQPDASACNVREIQDETQFPFLKNFKEIQKERDRESQGWAPAACSMPA